MSLFPQDPAEAFLLAQTQTLIPLPSWKAQPPIAGPSYSSLPMKRTYEDLNHAGPSPLVPTSLGSKNRKLSKTMRVPEQPRVPSISDHPASSYLPHGRRGSRSRSRSRSRSGSVDRNTRIPSPEEHDHWISQKREANRLSVSTNRPQIGRWARPVEGDNQGVMMNGMVGNDGQEVGDQDDEEEEEGDLCVICLMKVDDRTVVGDCGHSIFCFECINVWSNQSRKCPLCTAPMRAYLLHMLDSRTGPVKFFLPPKPTINPNAPTTTFASTLPTRLTVPRFRQRGPDVLIPERDIYARTRARQVEGEDGEGVELERQVGVRREVYAKAMFAKHLGSNVHTRYKPLPTPKQFAENPEYTTRATMWLRRELRVWRDLDVEFLTTYIISLMRSIDIRSEPAVRLLSDFLDVRGSEGRERKGTEHFLHEFVAFLRSPYRDLAIYDAVVQYEQPPPADESDEDEDDFFAKRLRAESSRAREPSIAVEQREEFAIEAALDKAEEAVQERSVSRSHRPRSRSVSSSFSSRSGRASIRSDWKAAERGRPPSPQSPKRWDKADYWVAPPSDLDKKWNESDSWVDEEMLKEVIEEQRRNRLKEGKVDGLISNGVIRLSGNAPSKDLLADPSSKDAELDVAHRGMRGWGEPGDTTEEPMPDVDTAPVEIVDSARQRQPLTLRIFGTATNAQSVEVVRPETRSATPPEAIFEDLSSDDEEALLDAHVWGTEDAVDLSAIIEKQKKRRASRLSDFPATPTEQRQEVAAAQAREAIAKNANKRAERKEQLLAKLVRAKMQARQKRSLEARVQAHPIDELESLSSPQRTTNVLPVHRDLDDHLTEASTGSLAAAALEAEAKAKAKAKLRMRLTQAKRQQATQPQTASPPIGLEQQPGLANESFDKPTLTSPQDRAALLREKLLKARAMKQTSTAIST